MGVAEPLIVRRLRLVMEQLTQAAQRGNGDSKYARYAWVMQGVMDEVLDELAADGNVGMTDADTLAAWFIQFGKVVEWCGSGDESVLPETIRPYLVQRLAITSGGE